VMLPAAAAPVCCSCSCPAALMGPDSMCSALQSSTVGQAFRQLLW
jgi:hypothetical protein